MVDISLDHAALHQNEGHTVLLVLTLLHLCPKLSLVMTVMRPSQV